LNCHAFSPSPRVGLSKPINFHRRPHRSPWPVSWHRSAALDLSPPLRVTSAPLCSRWRVARPCPQGLWSSPRKVDRGLTVFPFVLRRGDVPQRRVPALAVVEDLDVLDDRRRGKNRE